MYSCTFPVSPVCLCLTMPDRTNVSWEWVLVLSGFAAHSFL